MQTTAQTNSGHVAVPVESTDTSAQTGGPAFPVNYSNEADGPTIMPSEGMTVRDYFAALAMQAIIAHPCGHAGKWDLAARDAYEAADAMLKARANN